MAEIVAYALGAAFFLILLLMGLVIVGYAIVVPLGVILVYFLAS